MGNKVGALFALFLLSVLFVSSLVYKKYFVEQNYLISAEIPCDQFQEACFVYHCDTEVEECTGVVEEDTLYYKKIEKLASVFPSCDVNKEGCFMAQCDGEDSHCGVIVCNLDNPEDECSFPEDFSEENNLSSDDEAEDDLNTEDDAFSVDAVSIEPTE